MAGGKTLILFIHGMTDQYLGKSRTFPDYADYQEQLQGHILEALDRQGKDPGDYRFNAVVYGDLIQARQDAFYQDVYHRAEDETLPRRLQRQFQHMRDQAIRKMFFHRFADNVTYLHPGDRLYQEVHHAILQRLTYCRGYRLNPNEVEKVVIIAHSLGANVIMNYIWDFQQENHRYHSFRKAYAGSDGFNSLQSLSLTKLKGIFTFGVNIPLFLSGIDDRNAIEFPSHPGSSEHVWVNYLDEDDSLGYPLEGVWNNKTVSYPLPYIQDKIIQVQTQGSNPLGRIWDKFLGGTPMSHVQYWDDPRIAADIASFL